MHNIGIMFGESFSCWNRGVSMYAYDMKKRNKKIIGNGSRSSGEKNRGVTKKFEKGKVVL